MPDIKIAFFGGEPLAVPVLEEMKKASMMPKLIVCNPDRPVGRKQTLTPPPAKVWALENAVKVVQPETLTDTDVQSSLEREECELYVVAAYGSIIPPALLDMPRYNVLNVHPSLLPKYRGASPIRSAILNDERETGVTIIKLDEKLDHGPILAQRSLTIPESEWPLPGRELDERLARLGGELLVRTIPHWIDGTITPEEQEHENATYCKKLTKEDGELDIDPHSLPSGQAAYELLLKVRALDGAPGTYFFTNVGDRRIRVKIIDASLDDSGTLRIHRVIPEGKQEMDFEQFLQLL